PIVPVVSQNERRIIALLRNELFGRFEGAERTANFFAVNHYKRMRCVNYILSKGSCKHTEDYGSRTHSCRAATAQWINRDVIQPSQKLPDLGSRQNGSSH